MVSNHAPALSPLDELKLYLGDRFSPPADESGLQRDWSSAPRDTRDAIESFYRTTDQYLYDLASWHSTKYGRFPYAEVVGDFAARHGLGHILEFGCGVGTDGLDLLERGFRVSFYDFRNASTDFLQWRLRRRGFGARIYYAGEDELPQNDLTFAVDVLEHLVDPAATLAGIGAKSRAVAYHVPITTQPNKYPMHFPVSASALRQVMLRQGFRRVMNFSVLRYPKAFMLFFERPQFWMRKM